MLSAFNLFRSSDGAPGRSPMRVALSGSHPEVYASLDVEAGSGGASRPLITMQAADGAPLAQLRLDAGLRLTLACPGAGAATSAVRLDRRGHHLELHYAVVGEEGRCDLVDDGRAVAELSQAWAGAADATAVRALQIGDPGAGQPGADLIRNVEIATSPN
jgi:hypothetical protein